MPATHSDDTKIAEAAYFLWLDEGQPEGRDRDHWLQAAATLTPAAPVKAPRAKPAKKAATPKAAAKTAKAAAKPKATTKTAAPKARKSRKTADA